MLKLRALPALTAVTWLLPLTAWWLLGLAGLGQGASATFAADSEMALRAMLAMQIFAACIVAAWTTRRADGDEPTTVLLQVMSGLVPGWPLLVSLWLAAGYPFWQIVTSQVIVIVAGFAVAALARRIGRLTGQGELAGILRNGVAVVVGIVACKSLLPWLS
jgi:hypothetical protein